MKVVAVIPAYNEEKKIGKVVNEVARYVDTVVVIDDGSADDTVEILKKWKVEKQIIPSEWGKWKILCHPINLGQGAALQTGFEYAKKLGADITITYDADGQFKASDIPKFIGPIKEGKADVVLGSRFLGKAVNIPRGRLLVLRLGIFFTYLFSNIKLTDAHNGFRAFNKKALSKMNIKHNRWAHPSDVIYQIAANRFRVVEVPVTVKYTKYTLAKGQSSLEALRIPFELVTKALLE